MKGYIFPEDYIATLEAENARLAALVKRAADALELEGGNDELRAALPPPAQGSSEADLPDAPGVWMRRNRLWLIRERGTRLYGVVIRADGWLGETWSWEDLHKLERGGWTRVTPESGVICRTCNGEPNGYYVNAEWMERCPDCGAESPPPAAAPAASEGEPDDKPISPGLVPHFRRAAHQIGDLFCWCIRNLSKFPPGDSDWIDDVKRRLLAVREAFCRGCGAALLRKNAWMEDGCPCNSPKGVNDGNQWISEWRNELRAASESAHLAAERRLASLERHLETIKQRDGGLPTILDRCEKHNRELVALPTHQACGCPECLADERSAAEQSAAALRERLAAVEAQVRKIVCVEEPDRGVVLLSDDSPTHYDKEHNCLVYDHENFSPLGDALVKLHDALKAALENRE